MDELEAANKFRQEMLTRADSRSDNSDPLWFGWVIIEAFKAGAMYQRNKERV